MVADLAAGLAATFAAGLRAGVFAGVVMLLSCHLDLSAQPTRDLLANEL
jgi:tetrahydromethanopterin S-methyltransferase subunit F